MDPEEYKVLVLGGGDEAVLKKHAQMLSDARIDVVIFNVTNQITMADDNTVRSVSHHLFCACGVCTRTAEIVLSKSLPRSSRVCFACDRPSAIVTASSLPTTDSEEAN